MNHILKQKGFTIKSGLIILFICFFSFKPVVKNEFTNWDDGCQIADNKDIKEISFRNTKKIFTSFYVGMYQPVTTQIFAFENALWKDNESLYHLMSLIFHFLNSILVLGFIFKISNNKLVALIVSLIFAAHPVQVESVAWISARSTLIFSLFFLLSVLAYINYFQSNKKKYYLLSILFFLLSLLSKSAAIVMPLILFLIDYLNENRITKRKILEKIPFFILSILFGIIAIYSRNSVEASSLAISEQYSFLDKVFLSFYVIIFYIKNLIIPSGLFPYYLFPEKINGLLSIFYYLSPIILLIFFLFLRLYKKIRHQIIFGILFFIISISLTFPVFFTDGRLGADRYLYLAMIGIVYPVVLILNSLKRKLIIYISIISLLFIYIFLSNLQTQKWKNSLTLWNHVLKLNPDNSDVYSLRADAYLKKGMIDYAKKDFYKAIELNEENYQLYINRASILFYEKKYMLASEDYSKALELKPNYYPALKQRGICNFNVNNNNEALQDFNILINQFPDSAEYFYMRGLTNNMLSKFIKAEADFSSAIRKDSSNPVYFYERGNARFYLQNYELAVKDYTVFLNCNYYHANANFAMGLCLLNTGNQERACIYFKRASAIGHTKARKLLLKYCL
ncbi:MAG: hypothetical protein K8R54_13970 [Bacteroidales bacterium]|nr:hypothetical protein [Bacteroidales bacterium]